jgi:IPT/TIG domain-containing protein
VAVPLAGCGSAGATNPSSSVPPSQPIPDFTLAVTGSPINLTPGSSSVVVVSLAATGGFAQPVSISLSGFPSSITASPATFSLMPGTQQSVTFTAAGTAGIGSTSVTVQAVAGNLNHSTMLTLQVATQPPPSSTVHASIRTRYIRTSSFYDPNSLEFAPPHFTAYDGAHRQFFTSNPFLNEIDVFDATSEAQIATIPMPLAWGLDVAPTGNLLYVATLFGDVYSVDTSKNSIIQRYPSSSIGPQGFSPTQLFVLSDGRLALLGSPGGLGVDGSGSIQVWDPNTNSLDAGLVTSPFSAGTVCPNIQNIGAFAVSGDRTRILAASIDEGGGGEPICSYDPTAKQAVTGAFSPATFVRQIIPTPDGARFFLTSNLNGVPVFDAKTLAMVGQILGPSNAPSNTPSLPNAAGGAVMSLDGKTLYLVDQSYDSVAAFDTTSLTFRNWIPAFRISDSQSFVVISAIDETGLILGPMGHGVGFIDSAATTTANGAGYLAAVTPSTGPVAGGTQLRINPNYGGNTPYPGITSLYIGQSTVSNVIATQSSNTSESLTATTPPSSFTGPVDITGVFKDGTVAIAPEAFSYGPTILEVIPNAATAEGGSIGAVVGYGFGQNTTGLQISVGGQNASVNKLYVAAPIEPYPFPVQTLLFTIPPGTRGSVVDLTVTTANGSVTEPGVFHYISPVTNFPLTANLQEGFYDTKRDLYFFTDTAKIQVLSRNSGWQTPISLPGITSASSLRAITESPDNSLLAVSDLKGQAIYVLNPDTPASVRRFPMPIDYFGTSLLGPAGLALTNSGMAYFVTADLGGTGTPAFHKLDTSTGTFNDLGTIQSGGLLDQDSRVLLSPDGTRIYSEVEGAAFWLDTATDTIHHSTSADSNSGGDPDLAISSDGSTLITNGDLTDSSFNAISAPAYIDWETWLPSSTYGQKLYPDGSILVQPLTDGIDLLSRNTGRLLYRVQLPLSVSNVYDPIVSTGSVGVYGVITGAGVSFIDVSSLPLPSSVSSPFPQLVSLARESIQTNQRSISHPRSEQRRGFRIPHVVTTAHSLSGK